MIYFHNDLLRLHSLPLQWHLVQVQVADLSSHLAVFESTGVNCKPFSIFNDKNILLNPLDLNTVYTFVTQISMSELQMYVTTAHMSSPCKCLLGEYRNQGSFLPQRIPTIWVTYAFRNFVKVLFVRNGENRGIWIPFITHCVHVKPRYL